MTTRQLQAPPARAHRRFPAWTLDYLALLLVLVGLLGFFGAQAPNFLSWSQFSAIVNPNLPRVVLAVGMTFVLLIGAIDLSVGSVMALSGAVMGVLFDKYGWPLHWAIMAGVAAGLACGIVNGLVVIRWNLPSFIVTLGMLQIARGATYLITAREKQSLLESNLHQLSEPFLYGMPPALFIALAVVLLGQVVLSYTTFGRYMVAVGTNEEAVRISGVDVRWIKLAVFALSALLASLAAIIEVSRQRFANPVAGKDVELEVIAAVVVGGTSLMGGRGTVLGSFLGLLIIAVLAAGLWAMSTKDELKWVVTGCVIVAAVIVDHYRRRLNPADRLP